MIKLSGICCRKFSIFMKKSRQVDRANPSEGAVRVQTDPCRAQRQLKKKKNENNKLFTVPVNTEPCSQTHPNLCLRCLTRPCATAPGPPWSAVPSASSCPNPSSPPPVTLPPPMSPLLYSCRLHLYILHKNTSI